MPRMPHIEASFTITPQRTTTATPPAIPQVPAPEFTPRGPDTSAAMARNEKALCRQRLEILFVEVEQARAAVRAAVEAKSITKEALNRKREKLKLEMKQAWDRYDEKRALKLERQDKAVRDAEEKVRDLAKDYCHYKNRGAAAQARLREHTQTKTGQFSEDGRPTAAPVPPVLPGAPKGDSTHFHKLSDEFAEFRQTSQVSS